MAQPHRQIERSVRLGHGTVCDYSLRAKVGGLSWEQVVALSDAELDERLFPRPRARPEGGQRTLPDWAKVHGELRKKGVTLSLLCSRQMLASYIDRINDVLETPKEQSEGKASAYRLKGRISLDQVSFQFGPTSPMVVQDVAVKVKPGTFVALVGRSGAGKDCTLSWWLVSSKQTAL